MVEETKTSDYLDIDGDYLEGGGQILRNSSAFSAILSKPVHVRDIRARRANPGLAMQHTKGLLLTKRISNAETEGIDVKSRWIKFKGGELMGNIQQEQVIGTAGAITLLVQSVLPVCIFATGQSCISFKQGGTNVPWSPTSYSVATVLPKILAKMNINYQYEVVKEGVYPSGGGSAFLTVEPCEKLEPIRMDTWGQITKISGRLLVCNHIDKKGVDQLHGIVFDAVDKVCPAGADFDLAIERFENRKDWAVGLSIVLENDSGSVICHAEELFNPKRAPKRPIQDAWKALAPAVEQLKKYVDNEICVDEHIQDQLVIFMALAHGTSRIRTCQPSDHTKTALYMAGKFIPDFSYEIEPDTEKEAYYLTVNGIGFVRS